MLGKYRGQQIVKIYHELANYQFPDVKQVRKVRQVYSAARQTLDWLSISAGSVSTAWRRPREKQSEMVECMAKTF